MSDLLRVGNHGALHLSNLWFDSNRQSMAVWIELGVSYI